MPVKFNIASHGANLVPNPYPPLSDHNQLLEHTWGAADPEETNKYEELLQSSFMRKDLSKVQVRRNGFVDTVLEAYNRHHHLVLRSDDVWTAIICQFNFYVNAHSGDLRSHFVAHEGKKTLVVKASGTRYTVDFGMMARQMTGEIHKNVVDKALKNWILPDFTTTTHHDTVVTAVMMMATLKAYFDYVFEIDCGIPSITLEGEKSDWAKILQRLDKLDAFGKEPAAWANMLRPILKRCVAAFDSTDGNRDMEFWSRICHYRAGSGVAFLSGWIAAFCYWDCDGKCLVPGGIATGDNAWAHEVGKGQLVVDGVLYHTVDTKVVPVGFCEVDVLLDDNGEQFDCMMVAGHVGSLIEGERDTLKPLSGWFMFIKAGCKVPPIDENYVPPAKVKDGEDEVTAEKSADKKKRKSWIEKFKALKGRLSVK